MEDAFRCAHCDELIGVYEPLVVVQRGEVRMTSRAAEPQLEGRGEYYHGFCHETVRSQQRPTGEYAECRAGSPSAITASPASNCWNCSDHERGGPGVVRPTGQRSSSPSVRTS
jgi:hypothetical protein